MKPLLTAAFLFLAHYHTFAQEPLAVKPTDDFTVDGAGTNAAWAQTSWLPLNQLDAGVEGYDTKVKILYSGKGIYVLFSGIDKKVTSNYYNDFDDMYNADVFEVFFHPEPQTPVYFEYEINAYDKELVLLIPNLDGKIMGWRPWHYTGRYFRNAVVDGRVFFSVFPAGTLAKNTTGKGDGVECQLLPARLRPGQNDQMVLVAGESQFS
jgi:hypothetical protein